VASQPAARPAPAPQPRPMNPPQRTAPNFANTDDLDIPPFLRNRRK
jgi:hypothetical protein